MRKIDQARYLTLHRRSQKLTAIKNAFVSTIKDTYADTILAVVRRLKPRVKEENLHKHIPPSVVSELASFCYREIAAVESRIEAIRKRIRTELATNKYDWDVETYSDRWVAIHYSNTLGYLSQGYGADKYAQGDSAWLRSSLDAAGIPYHLHRYQKPESNKPDTPYRPLAPMTTYTLWAPIDPLLAGYVVAKYGPDFEEACNRENVNPRVYNPFLPHRY